MATFGRGLGILRPYLGCRQIQVLRSRQPVALRAHMYMRFTLPIHVGDMQILTERGCSFTSTAEREIVPVVTQKPSYIGGYGTELTTAVIDREEDLRAPRKRCRCAKALFMQSSTGKGASGVHDTAFKYNTKCDAEIRKNVCANVVSSGGTAIFLHEGGLGILRSILVLLSELYFFNVRDGVFNAPRANSNWLIWVGILIA